MSVVDIGHKESSDLVMYMCVVIMLDICHDVADVFSLEMNMAKTVTKIRGYMIFRAILWRWLTGTRMC